MATTAAHWNVEVTAETDSELRAFLMEEGSEAMELSRFVEDAVKARIFDLSARRAKVENAARRETDIEEAVNEALYWTRSR